MTKPLINPGMKVAELLDTWPELEAALIDQAPEFRKLRNPILRRTVARVATLQQAAGIAGISVRDLVVTLRKAIGQPVDDAAADTGAALAAEAGEPPAWLDPSRVTRRIDADAMLAAGQVPLTAAFEAARALQPGEILEITASFRPVPLVENLEKQGYRCFLRAASPDRFHLYAARGA